MVGKPAPLSMSFLDIDERVVEFFRHIELTSSPITDSNIPRNRG